MTRYAHLEGLGVTTPGSIRPVTPWVLPRLARSGQPAPTAREVIAALKRLEAKGLFSRMVPAGLLADQLPDDPASPDTMIRYRGENRVVKYALPSVLFDAHRILRDNGYPGLPATGQGRTLIAKFTAGTDPRDPHAVALKLVGPSGKPWTCGPRRAIIERGQPLATYLCTASNRATPQDVGPATWEALQKAVPPPPPSAPQKETAKSFPWLPVAAGVAVLGVGGFILLRRGQR